MEFKELFRKRVEETEQIVYSFLPSEDGEQKTVLEAMNYSVHAGGKRLRPLLVWEFYRLFGGTENTPYPFMAAIECIHTYSLVHDDLPAMDNDEYRRGKLTTHKAYGEDMAILAGDALLNYAFEIMGKAVCEQTSPERVLLTARANAILAKKAGIFGMVGGQTVDVENDGKPITEDQLMMIYENKTGALLEASMMMGAILAGASEEEILTVEKIASDVGIAFQIQDDILDITSTQEELGKPIGSDEKNHKTTYAVLHGLQESADKVRGLSEHAITLLDSLSNVEEQHRDFIKELFRMLIDRRN